MQINLGEVVRQAGLPEELVDMPENEARTLFMTAAVVGLSDGDMLGTHPPLDGLQADLYGENHFSQGQVARAIAQLALQSDSNNWAVHNFQTAAADFYTQPGGHFSQTILPSLSRVYPEGLVLDGHPIDLPHAPALVIEYGACLTSRSLINDQLTIRASGQKPFNYAPLTRTHFMNQVISNTYNIHYGPLMANTMLQKGYYLGKETGVTNGTEELILGQQVDDQPVASADIIICVGVRHMTRTDVKRGVSNAYKLLRESGVLAIRSIATPTSEELGTNEIYGWAIDAGFDEGTALRYESTMAPPNPNFTGGRHIRPIEVSAVILRK